MKFGPVPPREAFGGVTVHSIRNSGLVLKKGVTIGEKEIAALEQAGISEIIVARIEFSDVSEDEAAATIAQASAGEGVYVDKAFTGRANLFAREAGVLVVDKAAIDRLNLVDEAITLATLPAFKPIVSGEMIATVKIIPFAVARAAQDAALAIARASMPLVRIAPYRVRRVGVISTLLPGLADKVVDKTLRIMADRLRPTGASIIEEQRVAHKTDALAPAIRRMLEQGAELVVIFGASAIADRRDVIPSAIEAIGGKVDHFGMPVDPGNLLLMGRAGNVPVLGAPGCARSPKENGFDWVLARLLADLPVTRNDVAQMGVGGLLMEIVTRPQPRAGGAEGDKVAGLLLAAGRGTRMGGPNKLLAEIGGKPLARIVAEHILASRAHPLIVVTGHERARVEQALRGLDVTFVHNPNYGDGLSTSLKAGLAAMPDDVAGAVVCLGDMPRVSAPLIDSLIDKFNPEGGAHVVVPTLDGKRGNPVLWSRRFFADLMRLEGDVGARHVIGENDEALIEVAVHDRGVFFDVDTPEALALARDLKLSDA